MQLSAEQIRRFHIDGYLAIPEPVTTPEELAWMREVYDRMFAAQSGRDEGNQFDLAGTDEDGKAASLPQILGPGKYAPELENGAFLETVNKIVAQLMGPEVQVGLAHAIFKPAGAAPPTPWHQDEAYWDPALQHGTISVWMPLQEATIENGCLWFMPRSQEWEVLPHQSIGADPRVHGLEIKDTSVIVDPVACPLPPGGVTIHKGRTAHYAGPNVSGVPRRALIMMGGLAGKPYPVERRFEWNEIKQTARDTRAAATAASGS